MTTKTRRRSKKIKIDRDDLGECIHTALRKCCDSPATSAAWNVIYLTDEGWGHYLDVAFQNLKGATEDNAWQRLRSAAEAMDFMGNHGRSALYSIFRCFTEDDWKGFASFLCEY